MRTLIVDDHLLFSAGLRLLLAADTPLEDIERCADGAQALQLASGNAFEMILLDWKLGHGLSGAALIRELKALLPASRVVVVSGESAPDLVREAIDAGASGFVPKESSPELMIDALAIAAHGGVYLPVSALAVDGPRNAEQPVRPTSGAALLREIGEAFPSLTPRHGDVLSRVVRGMSNKEIARDLGITDGTVKQHLSTVYREIGVDNRTEAVYLLARHGVRLC